MPELLIENLNHNAEGIGRYEGKVVFVPFTIPAETVNVDIIEEKSRYSRGILKEIITKSPYRIKTRCPHYTDCGGCSYQHLNYDRQLVLKQTIVQDIFERIAGINFEIKEPIGMQNPWNYRNKVVWHISKGQNGMQMGFFRLRSNTLVDISQCLLLKPSLIEVSKIIKEMINELKVIEKGSIVLRESNESGKVMVEFINSLPGERLLQKFNGRVDSVYVQQGGKLKHLYGRKNIILKTGYYRFYLGPHDFFQVNSAQNNRLIELVEQYLNLTGSERILDAYCGVGTFSIDVAPKASQVTGIDSNSEAINNARASSLLNNLKNCQFFSGFCEKIIPTISSGFNGVIVDPPRAGLKIEFINNIITISPRSIVYVSCNPATLARDIKQFILNGYRLQTIQPIDMFPQTSSIETIVLLQKI